MLDFLLNGLYAIIAELMGWAIDAFLVLFDFDISVFTGTFPAANNITEILRGISWAIAGMVFLVSVIFSMMSPNSRDAENPLWTLLRLVVTAFLIAFSADIADLIFSFGQAGYNEIRTYISTEPLGDTVGDAIKALAGMTLGSALGGAAAAQGLVMWIILGWQLLKLLFECVERYVTLCVVTYLSPLAYCSFASKSTASFGTSFFSLLFGQLVLMWINAWSLSMVHEGFVGLSRADTELGWYTRFMVLLSFLLVAQKMDNMLQKVGFKNIRGGSTMGLAAAAGGALGSLAMRAGMGAAKGVAGAAGASGGNGASAPADPSKQVQSVTAYRNSDGKMQAVTSSGAPATREQISRQMASTQGQRTEALSKQGASLDNAAKKESASVAKSLPQDVKTASASAAGKSVQAAEAYGQQVSAYDQQLSGLQSAMDNLPDSTAGTVGNPPESVSGAPSADNTQPVDSAPVGSADTVSAPPSSVNDGGGVSYGGDSAGSTVEYGASAPEAQVSSPASSVSAAPVSVSSAPQSVNSSTVVNNSNAVSTVSTGGSSSAVDNSHSTYADHSHSGSAAAVGSSPQSGPSHSSYTPSQPATNAPSVTHAPTQTHSQPAPVSHAPTHESQAPVSTQAPTYSSTPAAHTPRTPSSPQASTPAPSRTSAPTPRPSAPAPSSGSGQSSPRPFNSGNNGGGKRGNGKRKR